jgi:hypothetical protein
MSAVRCVLRSGRALGPWRGYWASQREAHLAFGVFPCRGLSLTRSSALP